MNKSIGMTHEKGFSNGSTTKHHPLLVQTFSYCCSLVGFMACQPLVTYAYETMEEES